MKTEENKRMLALSYIVADLKAENIELAQRVHQLVEEHKQGELDLARAISEGAAIELRRILEHHKK